MRNHNILFNDRRDLKVCISFWVRRVIIHRRTLSELLNEIKKNNIWFLDFFVGCYILDIDFHCICELFVCGFFRSPAKFVIPSPQVCLCLNEATIETRQ